MKDKAKPAVDPMKGLFEPVVVSSIHYYGEKISGQLEANIK